MPDDFLRKFLTEGVFFGRISQISCLVRAEDFFAGLRPGSPPHSSAKN